MLAGAPLALAGRLDARAVDQGMRGAGARAVRGSRRSGPIERRRKAARSPALARHWPGTGQSKPASVTRLATSPPCPRARADGASMARSVAQGARTSARHASGRSGSRRLGQVTGRPRWPRGTARRSIRGSHQINREPRRLSAAWQAAGSVAEVGRDSPDGVRAVGGVDERACPCDLPHDELARRQRGPEAARVAADLV